jgi:hypothetical protein
VAYVRADVSEERIASIIRLVSVVLRSMLQLLVTIYVVSSSLILSAPMMEVIRSSETSILMTATERHIPEDGVFEVQLFVTSN